MCTWNLLRLALSLVRSLISVYFLTGAIRRLICANAVLIEKQNELQCPENQRTAVKNDNCYHEKFEKLVQQGQN